MFDYRAVTLAGALSTSGTFTIANVDGDRLSPANHILRVGTTRYVPTTDFTIAVDGNNKATVTWLSGDTIATGSVIQLGIAMLDSLVGVDKTGAGGGGAGDASAANQLKTVGAKAPGTAAVNSMLAGGLYTAAGVTLTDGQQSALQLTSTGALSVDLVGGDLVGVKGVDGVTIASLSNALPIMGTKANDGSGTVAGGTHTSMGGSDGTNYRILATDTSGRGISVGPVAAGSVIGTSSPVLMGGSDGTNVQRLLTDTSGRVMVTGGGADAATFVGNAIATGGIFETAQPTYTNGQFGRAHIGSRGAIQVELMGNSTVNGLSINSGGDGASNSFNSALKTVSYPANFNGSTWDRQKGLTNAIDSAGAGYQAVGIMAQRDDTSVSTVTENQFGSVRMSKERALLVAEQGSTFTHLAANATTNAIATAPATLKRVIINTKGAAANTLTLYDGITAVGTVIAVIDTTGATQSIDFDILLGTGLSAIMATGTAADITIVTR